MIRILLTDDHYIFAESLSYLLRDVVDFEIIGIASNGHKAIETIENDAIDLLVTDLNMPEMGGVALALRVKKQFPNIKILILTMNDSPPVIREAIQAGIDGYLMKDVDKQELVTAIYQIHSGKSYFQNAAIKQLSELTPRFENHAEFSAKHLSERELDVLKLITQEFNSNEIAEKLFISLNTVEAHRKNLFKKLNVKNSIGAIKFALRYGLAE